MDVKDLRTMRLELEAEIYKLCRDFKGKTGLSVVSLSVESLQVNPITSRMPERVLQAVRVEVEQI